MAGLSRLALGLILLAPGSGIAAEFRYSSALPDEGQVIDTRAQEQCQTMSLAGARCLPATDLLGPHRRLPSFRDILWVFGTAGLRGDETLIVAGSDPGNGILSPPCCIWPASAKSWCSPSRCHVCSRPAPPRRRVSRAA